MDELDEVINQYLRHHDLNYKDLNKYHICNIMELVSLLPEYQHISSEQLDAVKEHLFKLYVTDRVLNDDKRPDM